MKPLLRVIPPSALLVAAASIVAATSLVSVLRGPGLVIAAFVGVVVSLGAHAIAARFSLLTLEWVAVSLALFLLVGGFVSGPLPTPSAYGDFLSGLIGGWADLLSSVPPVAAAGSFAALPYALSWLACMLGLGIVRHVRISIAPAVGPALAFGIGLLFSLELRGIALIQGSVLVALSLALGWFQQRRLGFEVDEEIGNTTVAKKRTRLLYAGAALAVAAGVAPLIAPLAPGLDARPRFNLRDQLEPPWNPLDEPSPLAQIKSNYLDDNRDQVVFIARGASIPQRWGLATLANFDGSVWTVGDSEIDGIAPFVPIDSNTPEPVEVGTIERSLVDVEVEVGELGGPWLPIPGRAARIQTAEELPAGSLRFNARTGTAALPAGAEGLTYTVSARPWRFFQDSELEEANFVSGSELGLEQQAASVRTWSADVVEGADSGWDQVVAIRDDLVAGGYLADEQAQPGHSWARLTRFFDSEVPFGNEEQYAAAAGIAARNAGLESRIVVGYLIDPAKLGEGQTEVPVTRTEATAWLEVFTTEFGWVPIDVTPDRDNEPTLEDAGVRTENVAAPNPPPTIPPPPEQEVAPDDELEAEEDEEVEEDEENEGGGIPAVVLAAAVAVSTPLVLVGAWIAVIAGLKMLRRRKRRHANDPYRQVAGAWFEVRDRLSEFGLAGPENASIHEFAEYAEQQSNAAVGVRELADLTDQSAFAPVGSADGGAGDAWDRGDAIVSRVRRSRTASERLRVLASPGAIRRKDPA